jgi:hypothetical protein
MVAMNSPPLQARRVELAESEGQPSLQLHGEAQEPTAKVKTCKAVDQAEPHEASHKLTKVSQVTQELE